MDARFAPFILIFLILTACSERDPLLIRPLPPGLEYPWRGESTGSAPLRTSVALRVAGASAHEAVVAAERAQRRAAPRRAQVTVPSGPVDLNHASEAELRRVPGVGPAMAQRIMRARPMRRVEDLRRISGVGRTTYERMRPHVCVGCSLDP